MKLFRNGLILFVLLMSLVFLAGPSMAATTNPSPASPGYMVLPIQISGQYTATTAAVTKFKLPFPATVVHASATARASGGTTPTLTVDVKEGATSILSSAISITAGTISDGTLSDTALADESSVSVDLTIGGTNPTWDDITLLLVLKRL